MKMLRSWARRRERQRRLGAEALVAQTCGSEPAVTNQGMLVTMQRRMRLCPMEGFSRRRWGAFGARLVLCLILAAFATPAALAQAEKTPAPAAQEPARPPDEVVVNPTTVGKRVPPQPGDICVQCNHPIDKDDVVYEVRGQRIPLHRAEMKTDLRAQLAALLAQAEPRGAFIGAQSNQAALSRVWFLIGVYILVGLVFGALSAHRALQAGRNSFGWFLAGLLLNLAAYVALLTRPKLAVEAPAGVPAGLRKIAATYAPQPCGKCGTLNHPTAAACIGCGAHLEPKTTSEVARAGLRPA